MRFLASQGLAPTPENYAFAWQVKVDRRGLVAVAVDAILMEGRAVLPADVSRIMAAARSSAPGDGSDPRQAALRHQTLRLADLAAGAVASSTTFGRDLSDGLTEVGAGTGLQKVVEAMIGRTAAVEAELRGATREIEALREQMEAVREDAHRDALTGLLNRRGVLHGLARRRAGEGGVLAICDVDHFKSINDRFGHGVGDRVLKGVAASLADGCGDHRVARWGGEEFVVVMDGLGMDDAVRLLEGTRTGLGDRTFRVRETDEPVGRVTVSIGAASLRGRTVEDAIEEADRRLYAAKRSGRDRVLAEGVPA